MLKPAVCKLEKRFDKLLPVRFVLFYKFVSNTNPLKYILFVCLFFIQNLFGQNPYYHTINKTNGLPSNTVYDIYQDKNEMIWLATNDGICSYDGFQFKSYYNDEQTSKAGSNIVEDSFGRIWYCNFDGNIYYVEKGKLNILDVKQPIGFHKFNIIGNQLIYLEKNELVFLDLKTLKKTNVLPFDTNAVLGIQKRKNSLFIFSDYLFEVHSATDIKKYQIPSEIKEKFDGGLFSVSNENLLIVSKYSNDYCLFNDGRFELKKFELLGIDLISVKGKGYCIGGAIEKHGPSTVDAAGGPPAHSRLAPAAP